MDIEQANKPDISTADRNKADNSDTSKSDADNANKSGTNIVKNHRADKPSITNIDGVDNIGTTSVKKVEKSDIIDLDRANNLAQYI